MINNSRRPRQQIQPNDVHTHTHTHLDKIARPHKIHSVTDVSNHSDNPIRWSTTQGYHDNKSSQTMSTQTYSNLNPQLGSTCSVPNTVPVTNSMSSSQFNCMISCNAPQIQLQHKSSIPEANAHMKNQNEY